MKNSKLIRARKNKNDEFYTRFEDINSELIYYKKHFKNKIVYSNCDDPRASEFFNYFSHKYEELNLKGYITSCYKNSDGTFFSQGKSESSISLEYYGDKNKNGKIDDDEVYKKKLNSDGDFRSDECIELLKKADIVVTNPPFSLFREYIEQLIKHKKKFLVVGNLNAVTCKNVFPLIKDNKIWLGTQRIGKFKNSKGNIENVSGCWYTNLKHNIRNEELCLTEKYSPKKYPEYDNYNAINVDKTKEIPKNYKGIMGVPISFLDKYNPNQFEILGCSNNITTDLYKQIKKINIKKNSISIKGREIYSRIFIRNKTL